MDTVEFGARWETAGLKTTAAESPGELRSFFVEQFKSYVKIGEAICKSAQLVGDVEIEAAIKIFPGSPMGFTRIDKVLDAMKGFLFSIATY